MRNKLRNIVVAGAACVGCLVTALTVPAVAGVNRWMVAATQANTCFSATLEDT